MKGKSPLIGERLLEANSIYSWFPENLVKSLSSDQVSQKQQEF